MDKPRFVISASEASSMAKQANLTLLQLLPTLVPSAQTLARPPISNFHVAAVGLASDGRIFIGVNLEFPGAPLHHSVHAEQFLLTNLAAHSCPRLVAFAVSAAPCGHCRQFLQELRNAPDLHISINDSDFKPLSSILPNPFGPSDLLDDRTPFLLEPRINQNQIKSMVPENNSLPLPNGFTEMNMLKSLEIAAALEAANNSHAPYSGCPSGVSLTDCDGKVYKGSYMESAAYNPSLGPVQAALVAYVAGSGGGGYERITSAVLVEKEGAKVRQEETARLLLKVVSPKCEVKVVHCSSSS